MNAQAHGVFAERIVRPRRNERRKNVAVVLQMRFAHRLRADTRRDCVSFLTMRGHSQRRLPIHFADADGIRLDDVVAVLIGAEVVQAPIGQIHHDAGTRNVRQQVLHRQTNDGSRARQPSVDARIRRDDFVKAQVILAGDVGQRIFLLGLGLTGIADQILLGRQRIIPPPAAATASIPSAKTTASVASVHRNQ